MGRILGLLSLMLFFRNCAGYSKLKPLFSCQVATTETFYSLNATIVGLAISSVSEQLPQCVGLG